MHLILDREVITVHRLRVDYRRVHLLLVKDHRRN